MCVHLTTADLEAFTELDVSAVDDLLQVGLAFDQRQPPEVVTVQIKQVERDEHDLLRFALEFVLQDREVGSAVLSRDDDLTVDDRGAGGDVPGIVGNFAESFGPIIAAAGEDLDGFVHRWTCTR